MKRMTTIGIIATMAIYQLSPFKVFAEEIITSDTTQITESAQSSDETQESGYIPDEESETLVLDNFDETEHTSTDSETKDETEAEQQKANSWRFNNGESVFINMFASEHPKAWQKVNGRFLNSAGVPIEGAIKRGIDVSSWQKDIDWEKVKNDDVDFAVIRCGYGNDQTNQDDEFWEINAIACEQLGIPYGAYFYSYAVNEEMVRSEAAHTIRLLEGYELSYPIYLDLEDDDLTVLSSQELAQNVKLYFEILANAGYTNVGVYANKHWFETYLTDPYFDNVDKWVAQYNEECTYNGSYSIWQATSSGQVDGIEGNNGFVDLNFVIDNDAEQKMMLGNFVIRLYELVLGREPDGGGLDNWVNQLANHEKTGADVLCGFVYSNEFGELGLSDEEYINILYEICLGREGDAGGVATWLNCLSNGLTRDFVLRGLAESNEFSEICHQYGIIRGNINLTDVRDFNEDITRFVSRCYTKFLDRSSDEGGLKNWVNLLLIKKMTPEKVAIGFVFSNEVKEKKLSDEEYVKLLYEGLFDRQYDEGGLQNWLSKMKNGKSREDVFYGFSGSMEFLELIKRFGF